MYIQWYWAGMNDYQIRYTKLPMKISWKLNTNCSMNDPVQKQKAKYRYERLIPACKSYKCGASVSVVGS